MITNKKIVITGANSGIGLETLKILKAGTGNTIFAADKNTDVISNMGGNVIAFKCDVSKKENVDRLFDEAVHALGGIDIFYANAGFPYYEEMNYADWDRVQAIFDTNVVSPIYSYQKYSLFIGDKPGIFAITVSAIGQMAMPGFALYSASKFAMQGFQEAAHLEKKKNLQLTCLYPVATDTNFFPVANPIPFEKPFPVQKPDKVARAMVKGIEKGKKQVSPSKLFSFAKVLMKFLPFVRNIYWAMEKAKFERFKKNRDAKNL